jgi:nucleoside phosphorylase
MEDVVVFTALAWERRAVSRALADGSRPIARATWRGARARGGSVLLVETGIGAGRARAAALEAPAARAYLALGCAGALVGWLRPGDAVAASEVLVAAADGRIAERVPTAGGAPLAEAAARAGVRVLVGPLVASPVVVTTAREKARLAASGGALAVDMESAAIGAVARERGIPFHALRVVLDVADEDLPFAADVVNPATGTPRLGRVLAALAPPSRWLLAARLARGQRRAARQLGRVAGAVLGDAGPTMPAAAWRAATA